MFAKILVVAFATATFVSGCAGLPRADVAPAASGGLRVDSQLNQIRTIESGSVQKTLYVANAFPPSIVEYRFDANGDIAPVREIVGARTQLEGGTGGIAVDSKGHVYVAKASGGIVVFAAGANGNAAPIRTIDRATNGHIDGFELAVDSSDNLYVADGSDIKVFAPGEHGDAKPLRDIAGLATTIGEVEGVAVDATGNVYAVDFSNVAVLKFAPGVTGNVAPIATISGSATTLAFPRYVGCSPDGGLYITDESEVQQFAPGAHGNVAPVRQITFAGGAGPYGSVAFGGSVVFLGEFGNNPQWSVGVFRSGATGGSIPVRSIAGQRTKLSEPVGAAIH